MVTAKTTKGEVFGYLSTSPRDVGDSLPARHSSFFEKGSVKFNKWKAARTVPLVYWIIILAVGLVVGLYQKTKGDNAIRRRRMELESQKSERSSNSQKEE